MIALHLALFAGVVVPAALVCGSTPRATVRAARKAGRTWE